MHVGPGNATGHTGADLQTCGSQSVQMIDAVKTGAALNAFTACSSARTLLTAAARLSSYYSRCRDRWSKKLSADLERKICRRGANAKMVLGVVRRRFYGSSRLHCRENLASPFGDVSAPSARMPAHVSS